MKLYKKKIISREDNKPYLIRYSIFSCPWFAVKVHNILISDDACLHDHPWPFLTLILKGGYVEHTPVNPIHFRYGQDKEIKKRLYGRFSFLYRSKDWIHRLEVFQPAWTLVITFKKVKLWGFFTPSGWIEYFKYKYDGSCD